MKKIIVFLLIGMIFAAPAFAFLYQINIPTNEEIKKMSNDNLIDLYTDVMIERKASETFHVRAGFSPKEYKNFRDILKLIVRLRKEMAGREIEPPPVEEWLR